MAGRVVGGEKKGTEFSVTGIEFQGSFYFVEAVVVLAELEFRLPEDGVCAGVIRYGGENRARFGEGVLILTGSEEGGREANSRVSVVRLPSESFSKICDGVGKIIL